MQRQKPHPIAAQFYNPRRSSLEPNIFFEPTLSLLLQWCRAVCAIYGVPVSKQCNRGVALFLLGMEAGILVIGHQMSRNGFCNLASLTDTRMHTHAYTHAHTHMHTHTLTHTHIHTHTHTHTHSHIHTYTHTHTHTHRSTTLTVPSLTVVLSATSSTITTPPSSLLN